MKIYFVMINLKYWDVMRLVVRKIGVLVNFFIGGLVLKVVILNLIVSKVVMYKIGIEIKGSMMLLFFL